MGEGASGRDRFFAVVFSECLTRNRRNYRALRDGEVAELVMANGFGEQLRGLSRARCGAAGLAAIARGAALFPIHQRSTTA